MFVVIDYFGSFRCKVREDISDVALLRKIKARNRANAVLDAIRNGPIAGKEKPEPEWTFKMVEVGPDRLQETEFRVSDCLAEAGPLELLAHNCSGCVNNVRRAEFGCGGAIHYPITQQAERSLLSRLPTDLKTKRGQLLVRAVAEFNFDGSMIDLARGRDDLYQSKVPMERKWGNFLSKRPVMTSSQILHMVFGVGSLQPAHAKLVSYFLGFLNDDFDIVQNAANLPHSEDDDSTVELKHFFSIAALAGRNGAPVFVDA